MKKYRYGFCFCIVLLFLSLTAPLYAQNHYHILVLNSYHPGFPWSDGIMTGIKDTLYRELQYPEITIEYMDTKRHFSGINSELMNHYRSIYRSKYDKTDFDVVIVSDDNAYQFSLAYGEALFDTTPTVFCGVNNYDPEQLSGHDNFTGVVETADDETTIELMLQLHPRVDTIAFVTDWTTSGRGNRKRLAALGKHMSDKADFYFLDPGGGLTLEELKEKVTALGKNTAVFYRDFFRDINGVYLPPEEFMPELTAIAEVPFYSIGSFYLGLGIVGGKMDNPRDHGELAARMAVEILNGKNAAEIPILNEPLTKYMFDDKALKRFAIKHRDLPAGSIIINRPFSFYTKYTELVWGAAAVFIILLTLSLVLLITLRKSRVLNAKFEDTVNQLTFTLEEKTVLLQEVHHRVKNNLNIIVSLLNLQSDQYEKDQDPAAVLENSKNRVYSMALVHEHLYKYDSLATIEMGTYIEDMMGYLFELYGKKKQITYTVKVEAISLGIAQAIPLGLILNELVSNAIKHAFPAGKSGKIVVALSKNGGNACSLSVKDNGVGIPVDWSAKQSVSLGLELVNILSEQLEARVNYKNDNGTECILTLPIER